MIRIDPEFEKLLVPLRAQEFAILEEQIVKDGGPRDKILVWAGVIVDGHNRYAICKKHNIDPEKFVAFATWIKNRDQAKEWMIQNQLGRRNASDKDFSYYLGKLMESRKKAQGGDVKSENAKSKAQSEPLISTADKIAKEQGVSRETVKRGATLAKDMDKIAEKQGDEAKATLLAKGGPSAKEISRIANLPSKSQAIALKNARDKLTAKKAPKEKKPKVEKKKPTAADHYSKAWATLEGPVDKFLTAFDRVVAKGGRFLGDKMTADLIAAKNSIEQLKKWGVISPCDQAKNHCKGNGQKMQNGKAIPCGICVHGRLPKE